LSSLQLPDEDAYAYWLAYPSELADWAPIQAFRAWIHDELACSLQEAANRPVKAV